MRRRYLLVGALAAAGALSFWLSSATAFGRLPVARPIVVTEAFRHRVDTLRRDEALGTLLVRRGVPPSEVAPLLESAPGFDPRRARAGQTFAVRYLVGDSLPETITTRLDADRVLHLTRAADAWHGEIEPVVWQVQAARADGVMKTSLYESLHDVIPDSVLPSGERERFIADLADGVFGWDIDFTHDIAKGDRFSLVYERLSSSLDDVRYGRLVAARMETRGKVHAAFLLSDSAGRNSYFDEKGISLRRSFKRNPVAFLRISSGFNNKRFHPVLGIFRAHRGTDYSARMGTEIYATGDGVVRSAGRNGGYGNMVSLRHPRGIETRYAHMSRFAKGIRPGMRVRQGDVIGYVGATGLASGPHVHYEFLQNGKQVNALRVDLGNGDPLPKARVSEFTALRESYERLLDLPPRPEPAPAPVAPPRKASAKPRTVAARTR